MSKYTTIKRFGFRKFFFSLKEISTYYSKGLLHPKIKMFSLITYESLTLFGWKLGGLWLSHWLPSKYNGQGPEKYEKHRQNSLSAIHGLKQKQWLYSGIRLLCFSVALFWRIFTGRKQRTPLCVSRTPFKSKRKPMYLYPCGTADIKQCTLLVSSG